MTQSEKASEEALSQLLRPFDSKFIYYSPNENPVLKNMFKSASKKGTNRIGYPDRIFYNGHILIIFECKRDKLAKAEADLKKYKEKIQVSENLIIYYVAFVSKNLYKIYTSDFKIMDELLLPKTFGIIDTEINQADLNKYIKDIHNYIRDNTKISNEDKPYFIGIILLAIKSPLFCAIMQQYDEKRYIYDIIKECIEPLNINIDVFEFMRNDKNNMHFYHLVEKVMAVYNKISSKIDLLNEFYTEFVKYNNSDSKSLGIVLTPPHIVKLMIKLLNINNNDVVLDFCTGTGSFLMEALKYGPNKIIGCEYQTKLFALLKCNLILRDVAIEKYNLIRDDCFDQKFVATKSCINPPYGISSKKELDFVLKQLESLTEDGLAISIFPIAKINKNTEMRKQIVKCAKILTIIVCSDNLFYPSAGVKCCILLLQKNKNGHCPEDLTQIIDYSNDGYEIVRNRGRCPTKEAKKIYDHLCQIIAEKSNLIKLDVNADDWTNYMEVLPHIPKKRNLIIHKNEIRLSADSLQLVNTEIENIDSNSVKYKKYKISELFDIQKSPSITYKEAKFVHIIAAKNNSNGVKGIMMSNKNTFYGNKIVLITGGDGGAGMAFYQNSDFNISSATIVLSPKKILQLDENVGIFIASILSNYKNKYSRGFQWNLQRIANDTIYMPINENGEIDYDLINSCYEIE